MAAVLIAVSEAVASLGTLMRSSSTSTATRTT